MSTVASTFDRNVVRQYPRQRDRARLPELNETPGSVVCSLCTTAIQLRRATIEVGTVLKTGTSEPALVLHYNYTTRPDLPNIY